MKKSTLLSNMLILLFLLVSGCHNIDVSRLYPEPNSFKDELKNNEPEYRYTYIDSFSKKTNDRIREFIRKTKDYKGRKIAVFDGDGTLFKQVPYYVADEAMFAYAKSNPTWKSDLIKKMISEGNTSGEYLKNRIVFWSGLKPSIIEDAGYSTFDKYYNFYSSMYSLAISLKDNGFEIWVVTASPQLLYEKFLSEYLGIPKEHIIGTKSVIKNNIVSSQIIPPVPQGEGKCYAIDTYIKGQPIFAAGNSIDDIEMISSSKGLQLIVNPDDTKVKKSLGGKTLWEYATDNKWIIEHCQDIPRLDWECMACYKYKIRQNPKVKLDY